MRYVVIAVVMVIAALGGKALLSDGDAGSLAAYQEQKAQTSETVASIEDRGMSADDAYERIPHKRTPFRDDLGNIPAAEADYLAELFRLVDLGVVERVYLQDALMTGDTDAANAMNYDAILAEFRALPTPARLTNVERLIAIAIDQQRRYLTEWRQKGDPSYLTKRAPLVQRSHGALIAAYNGLMRAYPNADPHNKQAFFDHLCALDFI